MYEKSDLPPNRGIVVIQIRGENIDERVFFIV